MHLTLNTIKGVFVLCSSFKEILILSYANYQYYYMIYIFYKFYFHSDAQLQFLWAADNYKSGSMVAGQTFTIGKLHASPSLWVLPTKFTCLSFVWSCCRVRESSIPHISWYLASLIIWNYAMLRILYYRSHFSPRSVKLASWTV